MNRIRRVPATLAVASLLGAAGCGSTVDTAALPQQQVGGSDQLAVQGGGQAAGGLGAPQELGAPAGATGGGSGSGAAGGAAGGGSAAGPAAGSSGGGSGPARSGSGAAPVVSGATAPGITPTTIYVGALFSNDTGAANAALGAAYKPGDSRDYYKAIIDDLNKRGGILGRKVVPIYHELQATSSRPVDQQYEAACQRFTRDNKVFAIFGRGNVLFECAHRAGALVTQGGNATGPVYAKYPGLIATWGIALERLGGKTVSALHKMKYFVPGGKWPTGKIGLITWDDPNYQFAMKNGWLKELHARGLKETDVRYIAVPQTAGSVSDASAAVGNAVLRFQSQGIDHVMIADGQAGIFAGTGLTFLFLQNAKSQRYYPRYGFNTYNSPGDTALLPADQQSGMLAIDSSNFEPKTDAGITKNAARERCFGIVNKRGLDTSTDATQLQASMLCNDVWTVELLLKKGGKPTLAAAIAGAESMGTSFATPMVYGTRLGPGRHDGAELFRNARFDDGCECLKYTSAPYAP